MLTYDRRIPLPELDKRIEVRYYFYPFPSCFDYLFVSYTFLRLACQKVIALSAHSFPSLSYETSSELAPSLVPQSNSARSILDSTVSYDVTTLSQTSRSELGKRERLGTRLTSSYISFLFL